jgi:hypothetical protein
VTRIDKIIEHLKSRGAQYLGSAGDRIPSEAFTEHVFRKLTPSVRVRVYEGGGIEILFVPHEICAG